MFDWNFKAKKCQTWIVIFHFSTSWTLLTTCCRWRRPISILAFTTSSGPPSTKRSVCLSVTSTPTTRIFSQIPLEKMDPSGRSTFSSTIGDWNGSSYSPVELSVRFHPTGPIRPCRSKKIMTSLRRSKTKTRNQGISWFGLRTE